MTAFTLNTGNRQALVSLSLLCLMALTIGNDLLSSFIMGYRFYLSESMLFGMFWLLFVPFALDSKGLALAHFLFVKPWSVLACIIQP